MDNAEGWKQSGWFRQVSTSDFVHHFDGWVWDWLDVPAMIRKANSAYENPMIDRDPIPTWQDGPVALLGDAAHAMYPTGSNGGSQAIVDARVLGAAMVGHDATPDALAAYDRKLCGPISQVVLRNRGAGPFGLLNMVDERCGGTFDNNCQVMTNSGYVTGFGTLRTAHLTNDGHVGVAIGDMDLIGLVTNSDTISVETGATATFYGSGLAYTLPGWALAICAGAASSTLRTTMICLNLPSI